MVKRYSRDDVLKFLGEDPARPAMLATVRRDGRPHVAPVWYGVDDDGTVVFNTGADTVKGRNLRRTGRAALSVQDDRPPYSFVTVEGPVEVSEDLEEVRRWAARLGGRYLGADRAEEMGVRNGVPGELLLRLTVEQATGMGHLSD
jgi:PPOX class probable F420-dependent enzyme